MSWASVLALNSLRNAGTASNRLAHETSCRRRRAAPALLPQRRQTLRRWLPGTWLCVPPAPPPPPPFPLGVDDETEGEGEGDGELVVGGSSFTPVSVITVLVGTVWPAVGFCWVTIPSSSPGLETSWIWTCVNPAFASCPWAIATCSFTTSGTCAPLGEMNRVTVAPLLTDVPPVGFCRTTVFGLAVEFWAVTSLTWNPLSSSVLRATGSGL